jgi:hypothetical protein
MQFESKSLPVNTLMWVFGDSEPTADSVAVMADIVLELTTNLVSSRQREQPFCPLQTAQARSMRLQCSLPPTPYPAPPLYQPIPPRQIPIPSVNSLRRTLGKAPLHSRKYAQLQEHIVTNRINKAARKVTKDVDRPTALGFGGLGENLAELAAMADEGGASGVAGDPTRGRGGGRGARGGRGVGKRGKGGGSG